MKTVLLYLVSPLKNSWVFIERQKSSCLLATLLQQLLHNKEVQDSLTSWTVHREKKMYASYNTLRQMFKRRGCGKQFCLLLL